MEKVMKKLTKGMGEKAAEEIVAELIDTYLPLRLEIVFDVITRKGEEGKWGAIMFRPKKNTEK